MSASERFLFRGFKILNFSLKVLKKIGSFMRVSTVYYYLSTKKKNENVCRQENVLIKIINHSKNC